jgi:hypothetical protein
LEENRSTRRKTEVLEENWSTRGKLKYSEENWSTERKTEIHGKKAKYLEEKRSPQKETRPSATLQLPQDWAGGERLATNRLFYTTGSNHVGFGNASRYVRIWTSLTSVSNKPWLWIACYYQPFVSLLLLGYRQ